MWTQNHIAALSSSAWARYVTISVRSHQHCVARPARSCSARDCFWLCPRADAVEWLARKIYMGAAASYLGFRSRVSRDLYEHQGTQNGVTQQTKRENAHNRQANCCRSCCCCCCSCAPPRSDDVSCKLCRAYTAVCTAVKQQEISHNG